MILTPMRGYAASLSSIFYFVSFELLYIFRSNSRAAQRCAEYVRGARESTDEKKILLTENSKKAEKINLVRQKPQIILISKMRSGNWNKRTFIDVIFQQFVKMKTFSEVLLYNNGYH